ncbi:stage II sporulation protein R [Ruminococcus sp.]|uniref:stage II sporulation protein R n=1 Tax=Ruminococcus sp. TaxID=41978 RepID=UPI001B7A4D8D|nr:stage II sporulation protein R [Ruminococcus sp.]MBP5430690.1 stage II sporulation protein R [Ruminococcus sp.]
MKNLPMIAVEVMLMKRPSLAVMMAGLVLAVLISNIGSFIGDGRKLDELRGSVLRLHILANSDSEQDQRLKLMVRDELLESGIFSGVSGLEEAEAAAAENLRAIECRAENVLRSQGCTDRVAAELVDADFGERIYGDITMPAGRYRALRIKIGKAAGHNWWCVMYPPLCVPAAYGEESVEENKTAEEQDFDKKELDILRHPKKYKVRFAVWDKIKSFVKDYTVQNDKNDEAA